MKANLNIIIFNIYLHLLFSEDCSPTKLREPYIKNWKTIFEKSTGLSFKNETTKMLQTLQKIKHESSSIYFNTITDQWCVNNYFSLESRFISLFLSDIVRDYDDNFYLGEYELTHELLLLINEEFEDTFENKDINLYELTD